jgi:hypothetical protein
MDFKILKIWFLIIFYFSYLSLQAQCWKGVGIDPCRALPILIEEVEDDEECNWNYFILSRSCGNFSVEDVCQLSKSDFWLSFETGYEVSTIEGRFYTSTEQPIQISLFKKRDLAVTCEDTNNLELIDCLHGESGGLEDIFDYLEPFSQYYLRIQPVENDHFIFGFFCLTKKEIPPIVDTAIKTITSGNWSDPNTWNNGQIPQPNEKVLIEHPLTINQPVILSKLTLTSIITITPQNYLMLTDTLHLEGKIVLQANDTHTSQLLDNGTILGNGSVKAHFYTTPGDWHYICPPVTDFTSNLQTKIYYYDETRIINNWDQGWVYVSNIELLDQKPIMLAYDYRTYQTDNYWQGKPHTGPYQITVTNTDGAEISEHEGWNLIGNPYPSTLNWDLVIKNNIDPTLYIWHHNQFSSYVDGVGVNGGSKYIAPNQGFFVKVNEPNGTGEVRVDNSMRVLTTSHFKSGQRPVIKLKIDNGWKEDEIALKFQNNATDTFDIGLDALKRFGDEYITQLYTSDTKTKYSINSLPLFKESLTIPIFIKSVFEGIHTLKIEENLGYYYYLQVDEYVEKFENEFILEVTAGESHVMLYILEEEIDFPDPIIDTINIVDTITVNDTITVVDTLKVIDIIYDTVKVVDTIVKPTKIEEYLSQSPLNIHDLKIYDLMGRLCYVGKLEEFSDLEHLELPTAIYILVVDQQFSQKILIYYSN